MTALAIRLFSGSEREGRLHVTLPIIAVAVATVLMLFTLAAWQGFSNRAERTSWITPDEAEHHDAFATQATVTEWIGSSRVTIVYLDALVDNPTPPPGLDRFPDPGQVWVSGELADALLRPDGSELAAQLPAEPAGTVDDDGLAHSQELLAVVGGDGAQEVGDVAPGPHTTRIAPVPIAEWSTEPGDEASLYQLLAAFGVVLLVVPLLALGGSASRLVAARRRQRLSLLRLLGGTVRQVVALAASEAGLIAGAGAVLGAVVYLVTLPLAAQVPINGGGWYLGDVWVGVLPLLGVMCGVVALVVASGVTGLMIGVRDPLGMARSSSPRTVGLWRLPVLVLAVGAFTLLAGSPVQVAVALAMVMLAFSVTGPFLVRIAGLVMAHTARSPARLLAGRRLVEDPRAGWRAIAGLVLAGFVAGFVALARMDDAGAHPAEQMFLTDFSVGTLVVLVSAFAVAAVSAGVGGIARVLDQRGMLTRLRLSGAPVELLTRSRRNEVTVPLLVFGGGATTLGMLCGSVVSLSRGTPSMSALALFGGMTAAGVGVVLLADRSSRPLLRRVTSDLAFRD